MPEMVSEVSGCGEASHPGPLKLVLRGVSQQNMVSDASDVDPTLLDALEEDLQ